MAFERISGLFKRGPKGADKDKDSDKGKTDSDSERLTIGEPRSFQPAPRAQSEDRHELLDTLDNGFGQVAGVLHRLDHHLQANTELLSTLQQSQSQLPALMQAQQKLTQMTVTAERGNQAVLQALTANLKQRDEAQQAAMRQLGLMTQAVNDQRDQYADQLSLVMKLNSSGRRVLIGLLLMTILLSGLLFCLFLVAVLRPDIIRQTLSHVSEQPKAAPLERPAAPAAEASSADEPKTTL
jgi:hypothetical protein